MDIKKLKEYSNGDDSLRPYQHENKERVYEAWKTCQSVMLQMPTGTGKTRLFVSIIKDIFHYSRDTKHAYKVLIVVHRTELIDQIDLELGIRYGLAHGIIQSGNKERKEYPIQIASVQTLSRRLDRWTDKEFDFVIIDEAHHTTAQSYQEIIKAFPNAKLLGVTATPCRLSGEGFTGTFEKLILSAPISKFIEDGYLSKYDYYSVKSTSFIQRQIDGIKKFSNGDYADSEMERVCDNDRIRAQVVDTYLKYADGKKGIVYTINKEHNKNLCEEFSSHGIVTVALDSDTPKNIREEAIEDFRRGKIQIICNVNLFSEGFDCPDIEFIQLARPTKSLTLYLQQVGRGLRVSENKENTIILDNVGLYNKFGLPKARRHWQKHFEGKADYIKPEEEDSNIDLENKNKVKRKRHQNLQEGQEEVFYIEDPNEEAYLENKKNQFWRIIQDYDQSLYSLIKDRFNTRYSWLGEFDNVMILRNEEGNNYTINIDALSPQARSGLESMMNQKFFFYENNENVYRHPKDIEETISRIKEDLFSYKSKSRIKLAIDSLREVFKMDLTTDEVLFIVGSIKQGESGKLNLFLANIKQLLFRIFFDALFNSTDKQSDWFLENLKRMDLDYIFQEYRLMQI